MAAMLLALAAGLGACGGGGSTDGPVAGGGLGSTTTSTTRSAGGARGEQGRRGGQGCAAKGITTPPFNEGACVQNGTRFVVANGRSLMRLKTMEVALRGFSVSERIPGRGVSATPQGVYVLVRLTVRNKMGTPQRFRPGQTSLTIAEEKFQEDGHAEEQVYGDALAFEGREPIASGEVVQGSVVFDIPISQLEAVTRDGALMVANLDLRPGREPGEIGHFRIGVQ